MSIKRFVGDMLILDALLASVIIAIVTLYQYFITDDENMLYFGLFFIVMAFLGIFVRYRFIIDYVWTLIKKWR